MPIGKEKFRFACHSQISCYTFCCRRLELYLYPYDVVRLKASLKLHSAEFMHRYTRVADGSHPYFPSVMLLMSDNDEKTCPFLGDKGCTVYKDRPSACRTYPLERAVEKQDSSRLIAHYFLTNHEYCQGHKESRTYSVDEWERDQKIFDFNLMNDLWAEVDACFAGNPWQGEGAYGPKQRLAFMVCYNIDDFREYCLNHHLIDQFRMEKEQRRRIKRYDDELLKFGFNWLLHVFGNRQTLIPK